MEQKMLEQHLAQDVTHVAAGECCIARQRALVANLEHNGLDTTEARRLLDSFEELQVMFIADRDRLRGLTEGIGGLGVEQTAAAISTFEQDARPVRLAYPKRSV